MLTADQINEIHRLHFAEKWSQRKVAEHLRIGRHTLAKYLATPAPAPTGRDRPSKLDPYKAAIAELLQQDSSAKAPVIAQRLQTLGYTGGITILKDYLHAVRKSAATRRAYVRMEPGPGERFDIDWGHFGALLYNGTPRKLYAFCLVECHSRKMYLEFTHSQSFETFVRCHIHAFDALQGCARELWFDNLATAVAEHEGNLVRFNPRFLAFARDYGFIPRACHVAAAWEKGRSNEPSVMFAKTSGRCVPSTIWPMSTRKPVNGFKRSPTSANTAKPVKFPMNAFNRICCALCRC